jgi:hypothetical protein
MRKARYRQPTAGYVRCAAMERMALDEALALAILLLRAAIGAAPERPHAPSAATPPSSTASTSTNSHS